jgi:methylenetetrahydrofolate dehydrogenase (NADP+) / methenyltetrahydrofolate cyclohydrolase
VILLDGKACADERLKTLANQIKLSGLRAPSLVVIRVGEDPASEIYVKKKIKACEQVGIRSQEIHLSVKTSEADLLETLKKLNNDSSVDGILVQLPLPPQIRTQAVIESIDPKKDVDGFHPFNLGRLASLEPCLTACTPLGIMNLLATYQISVRGKRAVVIGRSRSVGRPMSLLLDAAGATVTVVHKETQNSYELNSQADILVVAAGVRGLVGPKDVKQDAVVIDVGIHRSPDGKLSGDVQFDLVKDRCSYITPVPGGVGPLTVCTLLENTLQAQKQSASRTS